MNFIWCLDQNSHEHRPTNPRKGGDLNGCGCLLQVINASGSAQILRNNLAGTVKLDDLTASLKWSKIGNIHIHLVQVNVQEPDFHSFRFDGSKVIITCIIKTCAASDLSGDQNSCCALHKPTSHEGISPATYPRSYSQECKNPLQRIENSDLQQRGLRSRLDQLVVSVRRYDFIQHSSADNTYCVDRYRWRNKSTWMYVYTYCVWNVSWGEG